MGYAECHFFPLTFYQLIIKKALSKQVSSTMLFHCYGLFYTLEMDFECLPAVKFLE